MLREVLPLALWRIREEGGVPAPCVGEILPGSDSGPDEEPFSGLCAMGLPLCARGKRRNGCWAQLLRP